MASSDGLLQRARAVAGACWRTLRWPALGLAGSTLALLTYASVPSWLRRLNPPLDAALEGRPLPIDAELAPWLARRAREFSSRRAFLDQGDALIPVTFAELGLSLDVDGIRERLRALPHDVQPWARLQRALRGPPRSVVELEPAVHFDAEQARSLLSNLAPSVNRPPRDAKLDRVQHLRIEEESGRELLLTETLDVIAGGARGDEVVYRLVFKELPAKVTLAILAPVDVSRILGSYDTDFRGKAGPRAVNIRRAARSIDGFVLGPGATFSFNRVVGPRSAERGFVEAPVIVNDETEPGLGGGVCQVATTLHAAAVFAGLEVVQRRSHSRASGYAPLGLDATVIDGKVDLRLRNPFDKAVMIHALLPRSTAIRVEILGAEPLGQVEHAARVIERHPFLRRLVERTELPAGSYERKQKGTYGYDIVSVVSLTRDDGTVATRRYPSKYYPVPEVLWIGPGTDEGALPPLPSGAAGVEPPKELEPSE